MTTTANAYVKEGRLCILGLHECELGPIPFAYSIGLDEKDKVPDGPVDFGSEELPQAINTAIEKAKKPMAGVINQEKMRVAAEELVERARAGDQNAMAMIGSIRENASRGNKLARTSVRLLTKYIEDHPVTDDSGRCDDHTPRLSSPAIRQLGAHVGEEAAIAAWTKTVPDMYVAALILANGPTLKKSRVVEIGSHFGEDVPEFISGVRNWQQKTRGENPEAVYTGRVVGLARTIQGIREGVTPISKLCPIAGAELGE